MFVSMFPHAPLPAHHTLLSTPSPPSVYNHKPQTIMFNQPAVLHAFLDHLTDALITYVGYQIEAGAQVVQLFDSWAHHLSPEQFAEFSLPYANRIVEAVRAKYPHVPLIFHANGGGCGGVLVWC